MTLNKFPLSKAV